MRTRPGRPCLRVEWAGSSLTTMPVSPGARLGPYAVTAKIGEGGMGEVWQATDTRLDRTVAIKVLPEHVAPDSDLRQRFEREARTISSLSPRPIRRACSGRFWAFPRGMEALWTTPIRIAIQAA